MTRNPKSAFRSDTVRTEDGYIIQQCLDGDTAAFGLLVEKYKKGIYALAYSKIRNFHDAQDITQEVFINAYRKLRTLRRWDNFMGWLYRITSNQCKMLIRARSRRPDREFVEDQDSGILDYPSIDSYRENMVYESIQEALGSLPEMYRQVLTLRYFGGMTIREMSRFLGISPGTIDRRLREARAQLKEETLAMMSTTYERHRLPANFTFHIAEIIRRIKIHPIPRTAGLPWGLSLAAGIIVTVMSLSPYLSLPNLMAIPTGSPLSIETKVLKIGEIPVDVLKVSEISVLASKQGDGDGGEPESSGSHNAALAVADDEGDTWTRRATSDRDVIIDPETGLKYTRIRTLACKNEVITYTAHGEKLSMSPNGRFLLWYKWVFPLDGQDAFELVDMPIKYSVLSPDGEKVVFSTEEAIWVVSVSPETGQATGPPKKLRDGSHRFRRCCWSPDSEKIFINRMDGEFSGDTCILSVRDGALTQFYPGRRDAVWSPDGRSIAYGRPGLYVIPAEGGTARKLMDNTSQPSPVSWSTNSEWLVYRQANSQNTLRFLRLADEYEFAISSPIQVGDFISWSPDGKKMLFYRSSYDWVSSLRVVSASGGPFFELGRWAKLWAGQQHWSPDSRMIVTWVKEGFLIVPLSGGDPFPLELDVSVAGEPYPFCLSADCRKLAFLVDQDDGTVDLYVVPVSLKDGRTTGPAATVFRGTQWHLNTEDPYYVAFSWSPDGAKIALCHKGDIWMASTNGREPVQVTTVKRWENFPEWSPDGKMIKYIINHGGGVYTLRVIPASGSEDMAILDVPGLGPPWPWYSIWSADSKDIISPKGGEGIWAISIADGKLRQIIDLKDLDIDSAWNLSWSPDGRKLAFFGDRGEDRYIFMGPAEGGKFTELAADGTDSIDHFFWSPDGKWLSYNSDRFAKTRPEGEIWEADVSELLSGAEKEQER